MTKGGLGTSPKKQNKNQETEEKYEYSLEIGTNDDPTPESSAKPFDKIEGFSQKLKNGEDKTHLIFSQDDNVDSAWETGLRGVLLSVAFFLSTSTLLIFCMNFVHRRMPLNVPPLPDLGHELIPKLEPEKLGDATMMTLVVSMIISVLFNPRRSAITIRFLNMMGRLYLLRVVSILVTSLPPTENHCRYHYLQIDNIFLNTLKGLVTLGGGNIHCGDLMFSGHTCMATGVWMVFMTNYKKRIIKIAATLLLLLTFYFIIATRSHYTADIWIAFWLTIFVYKLTTSKFPLTKKKISRFLKTCF